MYTSLLFEELNENEIYALDGGCWLCVLGSIIAGASTIGGALAAITVSAPVVAGGTIVGGFLGYLVTK